eukprot:764714-Hanusia_phi.AAC.4
MAPRKKLRMSPLWTLEVNPCSCENGQGCFAARCSVVQRRYDDIIASLKEEANSTGEGDLKCGSQSVETGRKCDRSQDSDEDCRYGSAQLTCSTIYLPSERQSEITKAQNGTQSLSGNNFSLAMAETFQSQVQLYEPNGTFMASCMDQELARKCSLLAWWNVRRSTQVLEEQSYAWSHGRYIDNDMNPAARHPEHAVNYMTCSLASSLILAPGDLESRLTAKYLEILRKTRESNLIIKTLRNRYKDLFSEMIPNSNSISLERLCAEVLQDLFEKEIEIKMKSIDGKYLSPIKDVLHRMAYSTRILGFDSQDIVRFATQYSTREEMQRMLHECERSVGTKHIHAGCSTKVHMYGKQRFQAHACINLGKERAASEDLSSTSPREDCRVILILPETTPGVIDKLTRLWLPPVLRVIVPLSALTLVFEQMNRRGAPFVDVLDLCAFASCPKQGLRAIDLFYDIIATSASQTRGHHLAVGNEEGLKRFCIELLTSSLTESCLDCMPERCWVHLTVRCQTEFDISYHVFVDFKILPKET